MDDGALCLGEALAQPALAELVHQEADGAAIHAVDRRAGADEAVQRLQHQPIAAERHDDIRRRRIGIAVALGQLRQGGLRLRRVAGDEGDGLEAVGHHGS